MNVINDYGTENVIAKMESGGIKHGVQTLQIKENKSKKDVKIKITALNDSKPNLANLMNTDEN